MKDLKVFSNTEFGDLKVLVIDGREYFPATKCAKTLGYVKPHEAVKQHCRSSVKYGVPHPQNNDKKITVNFIPEGDLFRLIVAASSQSKNEKVKRKAIKFEKWVFDEVLPSIRKHGMYATEKVIDEIVKDPDFGIKLFTQYKQEREKRKQLELESAKNKQIIGELKPKATYYDLILQNKSVMAISKIAKDYGMSAIKMNRLLHELGVQYKMGKTWLLYQKYADMGYTQSKTHAIDAEKSVMHTYWTQKGRLFLYELLKREKGLLPVIERNDESA